MIPLLVLDLNANPALPAVNQFHQRSLFTGPILQHMSDPLFGLEDTTPFSLLITSHRLL